MRDLLIKEMRLCASVLSYLFLAFGLMFLLPNYPVLCGAFFIALGIFQSFRNAREANDTLFSALLPIAKKDVVTGKFLFVGFLESAGFLLMAVAAVLRGTVFADAAVYRENALMNANGFALGMAAVLFGLFNLVFVAGFFKTGYEFGKPFVAYTVAAFLVIGFCEAAHYVPGLAWLNASGAEHPAGQLALLLGGILLGALLTLVAYRIAVRRFEKIDL